MLTATNSVRQAPHFSADKPAEGKPESEDARVRGAGIERFGGREGVKPRRQYWDWDQEGLFVAPAREVDREVHKGYLLLAYTGQRPGDCRAMKISQYDGERIQVVQRKTGAEVWIKAHRDLKPILDEERRTAIGDATILRAPDGDGFKERAFAERWDGVMKNAGLAATELRRQDLQRTAVIRLFEAGCNTGQVASITGHALQQVENILETYFVRTKAMGDAAILKPEEYQDRLQREREAAAAGNGFSDGSADSGNGFPAEVENP